MTKRTIQKTSYDGIIRIRFKGFDTEQAPSQPYFYSTPAGYVVLIYPYFTSGFTICQ